MNWNSNGVVDIEANTVREYASTDYIRDYGVADESNPRLRIRADGRIEWGAGSGATDLNLYRQSSTVLRSDDIIAADTGLAAGNTTVNTNTPSGATARAMEIFDETGSSLGFIPIYGSEW